METVSSTAVWYSSGLPAVAVRWVLIRDAPEGDFETQALLCVAIPRLIPSESSPTS